MKKSFILFAASLLALAGCSRNQEIDIQKNGLSLFAKTESPAESRTVVESGVHVYWEPGDEIAVFMGEKSAKFTTDITAASGTATFKGTFGDQGWPEDLDLWAVYPFSEEAEFDGESITTTLPSEQIAREGSFGKDMNLAVAHSNSSTLQFYNVGGGIRFRITEEGIDKVIVEGLNNEILAGKVKIGFQDGKPTIWEVTEGNRYITLLPSEGNSFVPDQWYYVLSIPQELNHGFRVYLYNGYKFKSYELSHSVTVQRSIFGSLDEIGADIQYQDVVTPEDVTIISSVFDSCEVEGAEPSVLFTQRIDEIKALPSVSDVYVNEESAAVLLTTGSVIEHVFGNESIFDSENTSSSTYSQLFAPTYKTAFDNQDKQIRSKSVYDKIKDAEIVIFNLFSDIDSRAVQNKIVDETYRIFANKFTEDKVCYCGVEDFTYNHLAIALESEKCKIVFINSHGLYNGWTLLNPILDDDAHHGRYMAIGGTLPQSELEKPHLVFAHSDGKIYYTIDWEDTSIKPAGDKIVYFSTCYTLSQDFDWEHACAVGWTKKSSIGQAYGLIMADYFATFEKSLSAFWSDLSDDNGEIGIDWNILKPLRSKSELIRRGNLASAEIALKGNSDVGFKEKEEIEGWGGSLKDIFIRKPISGTCTKNKDTYKIQLGYNNWRFGQRVFNSLSDFKATYTTPGFRVKTFGASPIEPYSGQNVEWTDYTYPGTFIGEGGWYFYVDYNGYADYGQKEYVTAPVSINTAQSGVYRVTAFPSTDGSVRDVSYIIVSEDFEDNDADLIDPDDPSSYSTPEAIDLGLPSGLKWASFNLGATTPSENGGYFAWGETEPKSTYSWSNYSWCNGNMDSLTKYNYGDGKTSLDSDDDAANKYLGDLWHTPSEADWQELINNCNWTNCKRDGVNGVLATSKITGAEVFFPFSGQKDGTDMVNAGSTGYYWTSTLYPFVSSAYIGLTSPGSGYLDRYIGIPIRPVYGEANTNTNYATPEMVDLGLPSGLKWASFNLGASKPEEYGDYYAWGETEPYYSSLDPLTWKDGKDAGYAWSSYKWCMGTSNTMTKYCSNSSYGYNGFTDNKTVLDLEDDAAHVNFGGNWRMPTDAEWTELREKCTWTWTTQNGVWGRLVTGSNGNSIFLPAAGCRDDANLYLGSVGNYWSSSLRTDLPDYAWFVVFDSGGVYRSSFHRDHGLSVRPVYAE